MEAALRQLLIDILPQWPYGAAACILYSAYRLLRLVFKRIPVWVSVFARGSFGVLLAVHHEYISFRVGVRAENRRLEELTQLDAPNK